MEIIKIAENLISTPRIIKRTKTDESGKEYPDFYTGRFVDNMRNGHGVCIFANGDRYEGDWKDNLTHGQGSFTQFCGDVFEGEFVAGQPHGKGVYYYHDGHTSEGWWAHGQRNGYGKHTYHFFNDEGVEEQTESYEGEYKKGLRHGFGVYTYSNGDQEEGQWVKGKPHGDHEYFKQEANVALKNYRKWDNGELTQRGVIRRVINIIIGSK